MEHKMTAMETLNYIQETYANDEIVVAYCAREIAKLEHKAEKARERAAEKKAIGDELYAAVIACVGSEQITAESVLSMIEGEDLSVAKIRARLSQGVKNGVLNKETVKIEGKSKVVYTLA